MVVWKCNKCGNNVTMDVPPDLCPFCKEKCTYVDVTCYIPQCGGPDSGNVNTQVFESSSDPDKA